MGAEWLYFGCGSQAGHYLFGEGGRQPALHYRERDRYNRFDGSLAPQPERGSDLYQATFTVLGGWNLCALSWWDRSQDKRPGSNSTIFAPGLDWTPEAILAEAPQRFPWVFNRLPQPLVLFAPTNKDQADAE